MEIGWIDNKNPGVFRGLLLPQASASPEQGQPLTVLGLTEEGIACGAAAGWIQAGGSLALSSLYVCPDYRRRGGGRLLVDTLCRLAAENGCQTAEAAFTCTQPEHETLFPFLEALGFQRETAAIPALYQTTLAQLASLPFFSRGQALPGGILPFSRISPQLLDAAYQRAVRNEENYLDVPFTHDSVEREVSVGMVWEDALRSFAAFTVPGPGQLRLAWLKIEHPIDLPLLLRAACLLLREAYPPETEITLEAVSSPADELARSLLPGAKPISHTYTRFLV